MKITEIIHIPMFLLSGFVFYLAQDYLEYPDFPIGVS